MTKTKKLTVAILAVAGGIAAAPALLAQEKSGDADAKKPGMMDHGTMMRGDMGGMMKMMGQMMENCNRMMQVMNDQPNSKRGLSGT